MQLPGVALITSMTVLSAIGDVTRFERAKLLVGYSGLGAACPERSRRVHDSGQTHRTGHITQPGRKELRTVLLSFEKLMSHSHVLDFIHSRS